MVNKSLKPLNRHFFLLRNGKTSYETIVVNTLLNRDKLRSTDMAQVMLLLNVTVKTCEIQLFDTFL